MLVAGVRFVTGLPVELVWNSDLPAPASGVLGLQVFAMAGLRWFQLWQSCRLVKIPLSLGISF